MIVWIPVCRFRIPNTGFQISCPYKLGFRIPSNRKVDSGFLELKSGFQSPRFWISQAKFPRFRNLDYLIFQPLTKKPEDPQGTRLAAFIQIKFGRFTLAKPHGIADPPPPPILGGGGGWWFHSEGARGKQTGSYKHAHSLTPFVSLKQRKANEIFNFSSRKFHMVDNHHINIAPFEFFPPPPTLTTMSYFPPLFRAREVCRKRTSEHSRERGRFDFLDFLHDGGKRCGNFNY